MREIDKIAATMEKEVWHFYPGHQFPGQKGIKRAYQHRNLKHPVWLGFELKEKVWHSLIVKPQGSLSDA